jgi:heme/copper-type cytochrome/quinol oxidase subunit 3
LRAFFIVLQPLAMSRSTLFTRSDITTMAAVGRTLFVAADLMLIGSLVVAYAMLRGSSDLWPSGALSVGMAAVNTVVLAAAAAAVWRARTSRIDRAPGWLAASAFMAFLFTVLKLSEYRWEMISGVVPTANGFLGVYATLTGLHLLHVVAGGVGSAWVLAGATHGHLELTEGRLRSLSIYWSGVAAGWALILFLFYLT